ncbi:phage regulatory protein/antirepressor Ant, partial [Cuspidothrix issatschenkoi LEGE 03284]|uniref:phage regulatory protein/antirepressor Ant n=1 Tax=Cuspidothrix issatschenkoi TaxID=230752 RepID=UPI0018810AC7
MTNITIQTIQGTLSVDSRLVAAELGILHKNFKELIKTYQSDFKELGHLSVTSVGVKGTSSYAEFYYLNEDQAYLALTYSLNTPKVRAAKLKLVQAFRAAREASQPQAPKTLIEAMEVALAALKEAEATKLLLAESEKKVVELAPKAESWEALCDCEGWMTMQQVAKVLAIPNLGRTNLFAFLRRIGVLDSTNAPYQKYENPGYFKQRLKTNELTGKSYLVTLVSYKGFSFI